ncbi:MAG: VWA domain-containing protein [Myxococcota bacterium]
MAAVLLLLVGDEAAARGPRPPDLAGRYRADRLDPVEASLTPEVELALPEPVRAWPPAMREALARDVSAAWLETRGRLYGPLQVGIGIELEPPLLTARAGGRVRLPVVAGTRLPIRGTLELPHRGALRRVVLLLDASSSANARTLFQSAEGTLERITVLEAERRALGHLLEQLEDDWLEFGLIAYGEQTWPIVPPGASRAEVREALEVFARVHPRGEGRTDLVCALRLAKQWLDTTPKGVDREIYVLTDGDLPHSGRFVDCKRRHGRGGHEAEARCEARRNRSPCPIEGRWPGGAGRSDLVQLSSFARRLRGRLPIHPLIFESDRAASAYRELASRSGGSLLRVTAPQGIDAVLPALIARRLRGVFARNLSTGERSGDLLQADRRSFSGELRLVPGPNDVELSVESERGTAALFRFRVHSASGFLETFLAELRERTRALEQRQAELERAARARRRAPRDRSLELRTEVPVPAAPAESP